MKLAGLIERYRKGALFSSVERALCTNCDRAGMSGWKFTSCHAIEGVEGMQAPVDFLLANSALALANPYRIVADQTAGLSRTGTARDLAGRLPS
ncbi:hypothetical protein NKH85_07205 [Mesorhizobium sp. M0924]|uniref:hypothetical protein n=1 Tax=unclassified Mesorhizobium TaxID=325217 RepID=UPI0033354D0B